MHFQRLGEPGHETWAGVNFNIMAQGLGRTISRVTGISQSFARGFVTVDTTALPVPIGAWFHVELRLRRAADRLHGAGAGRRRGPHRLFRRDG